MNKIQFLWHHCAYEINAEAITKLENKHCPRWCPIIGKYFRGGWHGWKINTCRPKGKMVAAFRIELDAADVGLYLEWCDGVLHVRVPQLDWAIKNRSDTIGTLSLSLSLSRSLSLSLFLIMLTKLCKKKTKKPKKEIFVKQLQCCWQYSKV